MSESSTGMNDEGHLRNDLPWNATVFKARMNEIPTTIRQ